MGLLLARTEKGIECQYWKIISAQEDYRTNTTRSILGLYVDRKHRDTDVNGCILREARDLQGVELKVRDQYLKWKEPKIEQHPTGERDEEGNPIMESVDTNPFSSSTDI